MKLDEKQLKEIANNIDMDKIKKQMDGLDIDLDKKKMNKVFGEIDIEKAFNLLKTLNSSGVMDSLSKIKNIQPFTNYKENCDQMTTEGNFMSRLDDTIDNIDINAILNTPVEHVVEPTRTVENELNRIDEFMKDINNRVNDISKEIEENSDLKDTLRQAKTFYHNEKVNTKNKYQKNIIKKNVNKRITEFYDKDASIKKTIITYLKYLYYIFVVSFIVTIFYKKRHKEKKMYVALLLLFIIPNFLIKFTYNKLIDIVGHTKLDMLYSFMIVVTTILIIILYFVFKFAIKKVSVDNLNDLINLSKVKDSISSSVNSLKKNVKDKTSGIMTESKEIKKDAEKFIKNEKKGTSEKDSSDKNE